MMIVESVNNDFEHSEKLTDCLSDGIGPMSRVSGHGWPISRGWAISRRRSERYKLYQSRTQTSAESVRAHTNNDVIAFFERG